MEHSVSLESVSMEPKAVPTGSSGPAAMQQEAPQQEASQPSMVVQVLQAAAHPVACVFHAAFKLLVLLVYIKGRYIQGSYVSTFIMSTVFAAFDFWTVKNITGRMLVGLRWWNHVKDDGSSEWVFESNPEESSVNSTDRNVFWTLLYVWPLIWTILLVMNVISFDPNWVLLDVMVLVFGAANFFGYWKCSKDAKKRAREWVQHQGIRAVAGAMGF